MEYNEFRESLLKRIQGEYEEADVYTETVEKNNGTRKERLVIREQGEAVVSCIYLEELYQCHGETGDMELCVQIVKQFAEKKKEMPVQNIPGIWEECRGRILPRLVYREWNREYLENVPHKEFLDLAVTFHLLLERTDHAVYSISVTNEIMAIWGTSADELFKMGMEHLYENNQFSITRMYQFIFRFLEEEMGADDPHMPDEMQESTGEGKRAYHTMLQNMYVMLGDPQCFASAGMLATEKLKELADQEGDFYIIPMSVNDLLLITHADGLSTDYLRNMVRKVNRKNLPPEERLSDSVYYFSRESGRVELAED